MKPYLLLQCRLPDDPMRDHERDCVLRAMNCSPAAMRRINLSERLPSADEIDGAAAILIGGSGAFHVYDKATWVPRAVAWMKELTQGIDRPVLGMCFGHQALLKACGAPIINDPEREELGTFELELTAAGIADPIFSGIPERFNVQLGHVDRAARLPEGWVELARSESQPFQAVRLEGQPVWGFQFHAELRMQDNLFRVRHYADHYGAAREEVFDALKAKHHPSPMGTQIMRGFARMVDEFWEKQECAESSQPSLSL